MNQKYSFSFEGIGTHWYIEYFGAENLENQIKNRVENFNQKYSRFLSTSLLSQLNINRQVEADEDLENMLKLGEKYYFLTGGVFDLFVADSLQKIGYGNTYQQGQGISKINFQDGKIFLSGGQNIDLGGIGKGYLIKKIQNFFEARNIFSYIINGGGDIAISQKENEIGNIILQHPKNVDMAVGEIYINCGAHAASGSYRRKWVKDGKNVHHLIDTKTGTSSKNPFLAMHIVCDDIILADIASTSLFVAPIEKIENLAAKLGVEFFIVFEDLKTIKSKNFPEIF